MNPIDTAREYLQTYWGFDDFRPAQAAILPDILMGHDVLCVMPTGGGKSLLFQLPALIDEGATIVISPLIALMRDQVEDCIQRGIPATYINSELTPEEQEQRFDDFVGGAFKLIYVAPERLRVERFRQIVKQAHVQRIVVDEAHCASQWGHDFRPMYQRIHEIGDAIEAEHGGRPPVLAVTATATAAIEDDIAQALGMSSEYVRFIADPIRPNLSFQAYSGFSAWRALETVLKEHDFFEGRYVIYVGTRAGAEMVAKIAQDHLDLDEDDIGFYHAGMRMEDRIAVQDRFKSGECRMVVATSAFGMGIDVPDIRVVIHFGVPDSIESYVQQAGRAGRDGKHSYCVLLNDRRSIDLQQRFVDWQNPPYFVYQKVWDYLNQRLPHAMLELKLTVDAIAEKTGIAETAAIGTVLSAMESKGMVDRTYAPPVTPVFVDVAKLTGALMTKPSTEKVRADLLERCDGIPKPVVRLVLDKAKVAKQIGMAESTLTATLHFLGQKGLVRAERPFTGKTTTVRALGAPLSDYFSKEDIEAKRLHAQKRLDQMIEYAGLSSEKQRIKMIRDYFLGEAVKERKAT